MPDTAGWPPRFTGTAFKQDEESRIDMSAKEKACERCGKALARQKPSRMARIRFCSTSCAYARRIETNPKRQRPCPVCSKPIGNGDTRTCSSRCGYELRKRETHGHQRACGHCGVKYWPRGMVRQRFCSVKCLRAFTAKRPAFVEAVCVKCGAKFRRTIAALKRVRNAFCSRECVRAFHVGENAPMFRGDKDPNRGAAWNRLAAAIRLRDSYSCRRCGRCEHGTARLEKLSVDHVKPWRSFTDKIAANHPANLVSLCRPCHSYKTTVVERALLRGDVVTFKQWVKSLHLKSATRGISVTQDESGNWHVQTLDSRTDPALARGITSRDPQRLSSEFGGQ